MKNIIIGKRSILSLNLKKKLNSSRIISTEEFKNLKLKTKSNLIINLFYPSRKLSTIIKYSEFIYQSLYNLSIGLDTLDKSKINKIIYTSSSSVYGLQNIDENSVGNNRNIYSTAKFLAESLIKNFCSKNNIYYSIARVFNLYGENDNFSIISKLIKAYKNKSTFFLNNNGSAIRDFISYDEVAIIYKKILKVKKSEIIDVGTGNGVQIKDLLAVINNRIKIRKKNFAEVKFSVSDINSYNSTLSNKNLANFIKKKLGIKKNIYLKSYRTSNKNILKDYINKTIIYGAGNAGKQLYDLIKKTNRDIYCFVDDNKKKQNSFIGDKKIISFLELKKLSKQNTISNIVISIPSIKKRDLLKKINQLNKISSTVSYLPLKENLTSDTISIDDIGYSKLIDIFNRKTYEINEKLLNKFKKKTVLVTGAAGSIGMAICSKLKGLKLKRILAFDKSEIGIYNIKKKFTQNNFKFVLGDINSNNCLKNLKKKYKIDIVFHAAAHKHLNILEENICEAVKNNIFGTLNVIKCFKESKVVVISTDKAAKPKSVLGITKRISEVISQNFVDKDSKIIIVRFGNVFASQGSAINLFLKQIQEGGPVTLTNENVERYFMSSSEAANLVLQVSQYEQNRKIFVLNMGKQVKLKTIIEKLIEIHEQKNPYSNIEIKYIGLQKGEKISEKLYLNKIQKSKLNKDILIANEPNYNLLKTNKLINKLEILLNDYKSSDILKEMKLFLKQELN